MRNLRVLVVEDEPANREVAEVILESEGHVVTTCENGAEAIDLCIKQGVHFDVILMDILMPVMDGLEATRQLKADPRTKDTPIICVSARASGSDRQQGLSAGCDYYMLKPYRRKDLLTVLGSILEGSGLLSPEEAVEIRQGQPRITP